MTAIFKDEHGKEIDELTFLKGKVKRDESEIEKVRKRAAYAKEDKKVPKKERLDLETRVLRMTNTIKRSKSRIKELEALAAENASKPANAIAPPAPADDKSTTAGGNK